MAKVICCSSLRLMKAADLFRGCLYGGLLGDCYGAPFELKKKPSPVNTIMEMFDGILKSGGRPFHHTDDTEMSLGICASLRENNGLNVKHLAKRFAEDYLAAPPWYRYGPAMRKLFVSWKQDGYKDVRKGVHDQFDGTGTMGNGGGMRVSPAALFAFSFNQKEFNDCILQVTAVTHTHPSSLYGALLQANAIRRLITMATDSSTRNPDELVSSLLEGLRQDLKEAEIEQYAAGDGNGLQYRLTNALKTYMSKLDTVEAFVRQVELPWLNDVINQLGNDAKAPTSIPTALYVFLRSLTSLPHIPYESLPLRCATYAISLGNDTDTIASMACALAGAWVGAEPITTKSNSDLGQLQFPTKIMQLCDGLAPMTDHAYWLFQHSLNKA